VEAYSLVAMLRKRPGNIGGQAIYICCVTIHVVHPTLNNYHMISKLRATYAPKISRTIRHKNASGEPEDVSYS